MKSLRKFILPIFLGIIVILLLPPIEVSGDEKPAEQKPVRFATVEWEPYYGSRLEGKGYVAQITRAAFERMGYPVEIRFMPWKRAVHDTKNGYFDALLGLYYSKDREIFFHYSNPIADVQVVFFAKKGRNIGYKTLRDLESFKIGIEREYVYTEEFDSADYLKKEPVRNIELNFNKLMNDRIDLVAASRNVFLHMIKQRHPEALEMIEIIEPPLTVGRIYNGFARNSPVHDHEKISRDFNRGLWRIKSDGTFDRILKKHGF